MQKKTTSQLKNFLLHSIKSIYFFYPDHRQRRQIQPLECRVPGVDDVGTCMFVYHCMQVSMRVVECFVPNFSIHAMIFVWAANMSSFFL